MYAASLPCTAADTAHAQSSVSFQRHVSVTRSVCENVRSVPIPAQFAAAASAQKPKRIQPSTRSALARTGCSSALGVALGHRRLHALCGAVWDAHVMHTTGPRKGPVRDLAGAVRVGVRDQQRQPLRRHGFDRAKDVRLPQRPPHRRHHRNHSPVQRPAGVLRRVWRQGSAAGLRCGEERA